LGNSQEKDLSVDWTRRAYSATSPAEVSDVQSKHEVEGVYYVF